MDEVAVLLFAKFPEPGKVNTRMCPPLSPKEAAALHRASLSCVCASVLQSSSYALTLVVTPDDRLEELKNLSHSSTTSFRPQGRGDLGERLRRAVVKVFDEGCLKLILLGADSPSLPAGYLDQAVAELDRHASVIGPCDDGGYYLLGMSSPMVDLLDDIEWGTDRVLQQTLDRASGAGVDLFELPPWYDLDRFGDLSRAADDLQPIANPSNPQAIALRDLITTYLDRYATWKPSIA